jgi:hypothetical protein
MKKCKCYSCGYTWLLSGGLNGHGRQHACPKCGSDRVQYTLDDMVRDLHAGIVTTNPALLFGSAGSGNGHTFQKWMTD